MHTRSYLNRRFPIFFAGEGAGGGGGTAVLEKPITPPAVAGAEDFDPMSYEPPSPDEVQKFVEGADLDMPKGTVTPLEKPKTETPEVKPPEEKKEEQPKPAPKAPTEKEPASQLRGRLKELETERDKLKTELEAAKTDTRIEELNKKITENERRVAEKEEALKKATRKLQVYNPLLAEPLVKLRDAFNVEYKGFVDEVPGLDRAYKGLLDEFEALPRGKDEYGDKLKEFRGRVRDEYGEDGQTVLDAIKKGFEFRKKHSHMAEEVQRDGERLEFEATRNQWQSQRDELDKEWAGYFAPPADAETVDPYNHQLFLKKFEEVLPKEEVEKIDRNLKGFVDRVFNGAQPRTKDDFPGMSEEQVQQELAAMEERVGKERKDAKRILAVGAKLLYYFRPWISEYQKLRARAEGKAEAQPPDPTGKSGVKPSTVEADELLEYQPPTVTNADFE